MEDIVILEKRLNERIRDLIIGKEIDKEEILSDLKDFFKNKKQEDIDKLNPTNIRLFYVALDILENNRKLYLIHLANLDYLYSYKDKPLKYSWKSSEFNLSKDFEKIKKILEDLSNKFNLSDSKVEVMGDFLRQADEMFKQEYSSDMEEIGIFNDSMDSYIHLEYHAYDDEYRNERVGEFNILLFTQEKEILEILPNNNGTIYSNLIFKENFLDNPNP